MRFNRKTFFDKHRAKFGGLAQLQVDGLSFLLDKIEADPDWKSVPQIAYFLATIKHETGITRGGKLQTYQPIKELRGREGTKIRKIQDRYWPSGFFGRGYVQITWEDNYRKFGIENDPEQALNPDTAYDIAARGMRKGMFTKHKLSDFVNGKVDYVNARKVVNGLDKADLIANYAESFEDVLFEAAKEVSADAVEKKPEPIVTEAAVVVQAEVAKETNPKEKAEVSGPKSWIAAVTTFMASAGAGVFSWAKGASTEIVVAFFASAALVGVVYVVARYWYRNKENQRLADVQLAREKMAQEITLMKMKSAMQQESNTVEVAH